MDSGIFTFGEYLTYLLKKKKVSITKFAEFTNAKSRNSIQRLLKDKSGLKIIQKYYSKIVQDDPLNLSLEELEQLKESVSVSTIGKKNYYARKVLLELFKVNKTSTPIVNTQSQIEGTSDPATLSQLFQLYSNYSSVNILIFDATLVSLSDVITSLIHNSPNTIISIDQIIFTGDDSIQNADIIACIHNLLHCKNYNLYYHSSQGNPTNYHTSVLSDFIVIDKLSNSGLHSTDLIKIEDKTHFSLLSDNPGDSLYRFYSNYFSLISNDCQSIKRAYDNDDPLNKLINLSVYHMNLEKRNAEYLIMQNMCLSMVHPDILYNLLVDADFMGLSEEHPAVQKITQLMRARFNNFYNVQKMKVNIFTRRGLLDFVRTGTLTDHLFCFRPFTKGEIKSILEFFINQIENNPFFKLYLLKDDYFIGHVEYCYYENQVLSLIDSFSGYDQDYDDWIIAAKPILNIFDDFIKNELIPLHTLPESETLSFLRHLISTIEIAH